MTVDIVAVGSSLGGLHAMEQILRGLPADFGPPLVFVQHRRAETESRLVELLQGYAPLPVREPNDRDAIVPGHVYLAPANYHLLVDDGLFSLSVDPPVWYARPSIDVLFESIADA